MRKLLSLCALATLTAACSSDKTPVGVDPASCTVGSISVGDTRTGTVDQSSCATYDWYWWEDSVHFSSYNITVQEGKGYLFTLGGPQADTSDRSLAIVANDAAVLDSGSIYLAVHDRYDNRPGKPAQLFFVAPRSGTFSLRAFTRNIHDSFDYTLTERECTPRAIDITGAYGDTAATLGDDDCTVAEPYFTLANRGGTYAHDSSHVALYTVYFDGYSQRTITVTSSDFTPGFQVEGPGFDTWCNTYYCSGNWAADSYSAPTGTVSSTMAMWVPGTYTIAVGAVNGKVTGNYTLTISAQHDPNANVRLLAPSATGLLQLGQARRMTGPR